MNNNGVDNMAIFEKTASEQKRIDEFIEKADKCLEKLSGYEEYAPINALKSIREHFDVKIQDFYRSDRKLNIGIIGQVAVHVCTLKVLSVFGFCFPFHDSSLFSFSEILLFMTEYYFYCIKNLKKIKWTKRVDKI